MSKFTTRAAITIAAAWAVSAAAVSTAAESGQKLDAQGRVVQQMEADGRQVVHTYSQDGTLRKRETSRGERVHFDKKGRAQAQSTTPSTTSTEDKR